MTDKYLRHTAESLFDLARREVVVRTFTHPGGFGLIRTDIVVMTVLNPAVEGEQPHVLREAMSKYPDAFAPTWQWQEKMLVVHDNNFDQHLNYHLVETPADFNPWTRSSPLARVWNNRAGISWRLRPAAVCLTSRELNNGVGYGETSPHLPGLLVRFGEVLGKLQSGMIDWGVTVPKRYRDTDTETAAELLRHRFGSFVSRLQTDWNSMIGARF